MTAPAPELSTRVARLLAVSVVVGVVAVAWLLIATLVGLDGVTSQFRDAQTGADNVSNTQRDLGHIETGLARAHQSGDLTEAELHYGLAMRQLQVTLLASHDPEVLEFVRGVRDDLQDFHATYLGPLPEDRKARTRVLDAAAQRMAEIERGYKPFYGRAVETFYDTTSQAVAQKQGAQARLGIVLALTVALSAAWAVDAHHRSRSDLAAAYRTVKASEERYQSLVQNSADLIVVTDASGAVTYASPSSADVVGLSPQDLVGIVLRQLVHPADVDAVIAADAELEEAGSSLALSYRLRHTDGSWRTVEVVARNHFDEPAVEGLVLNLRDVTERARLESKLRHAQKMESVGQLAAGIAHEINTPIQFVGDNVRFLSDVFSEVLSMARGEGAGVDADFLAAEVPDAITQTLEGIDRMAVIVRAMKAFGHPANDHHAPADLNEAVRNTVVVANHELKYVADVVLDLGELPPVWCHLGDVNQVILNLVVNAAHAVKEKVGDSDQRGTITVGTRTEGSDFVLTVTDTGCGIPAEIVDRVFEPFFTTKGVGVGTGQGLALVYTLVTERHGGSIAFESLPGVGTTFAVRLPLHAGGAPERLDKGELVA